ncbi:MAG: 23S rRNA (uracil(1939)-C(5))-methyltransferase RlmD [Oscillospiraceae bacterium]|nr:23S rRNA (uracil(1939)-C(5))-methyltransferase RlmD [Oscillospiraceae bacterium]
MKKEVLNILSKGEGNYDKVEVCPHYSLCGGCSMLHVSYDYQLKIKEEAVLKLFKVYFDDLNYEGIVRSPEVYQYRNKMEYTFGDFEKGGDLEIGLHVKKKNFSIVTTDKCKLVQDDFLKILSFCQNYFNKLKIPHYKVMKREGLLRNLVLRLGKNTGQIMINLVTTSTLNLDYRDFCEGLLSLNLNATIKSILHTVNDSLSEAIIPERLQVLYGEDHIYEIVLGLKFKISPFSFFQTNTRATEILYETVIDFFGDKKGVIFDLYCGTGTISQVISKKASHVYGVEIVQEAVTSAIENAKLNGITNCEFLCGDINEIVSKLHVKPDVIILDPPRPGVGKKALKNIIEFNSPKIIYVSCNPNTLRDDLVMLKENGYKVIRMKLVDLFPNTYHVETVVLLSL